MSNGVRRIKRLQHKHRNNNNNNSLPPHKHGKCDGFQRQVRRCKGRGLRNDNLLLQLPEEVLTDEILIRLPAKQLARMRCVSKPFNGYISQPRFIKSHLDRNLVRNNSKDNEILLVINPNTVFTKRVQVTAHPSRSPDIQLNDLIKLPPISHVLTPNGSPSRTHEDLSYKIQFGYDPKSDDYKVVKLMDHCEPEMQVEVYSMRKGTWQFISERFPSRAHPVDCGNKVIAGCHDGHVYRWGISLNLRCG
uniref:putative F-box protein At1g32420 n=1 Tax=Erigeron canadensis TaxID=72917 RepID=UPI001CB97D98|nr:putative F-box protein At1g32420 [Erigeron canadensis]